MSDCSTDIIRIREFVSELGFIIDKPITVYGDNFAAEMWAKAINSQRKAKHIEIRYHYIRSKVIGEAILPQHVSLEENNSDGLTKPHCKNKFGEFRNRIGVMPGPA